MPGSKIFLEYPHRIESGWQGSDLRMHFSYNHLSSIRNSTLILRRPNHKAPSSIPFHISKDGIRFINVHAPFRQITEISNYWYDDLRCEDTVIDIGANVGAFCIRAAKKSQKTVAIEPVTIKILRHNIDLNGVAVKVIEGALGDGNPAEIEWDECRVHSRTYTLKEIIRIAGGCDFLKCDCEGAEWQISPKDLSSIRRIEMELHQPPIGEAPKPGLLEYISSTFMFIIDRNPCHSPLGQMGILHAWRIPDSRC